MVWPRSFWSIKGYQKIVFAKISLTTFLDTPIKTARNDSEGQLHWDCLHEPTKRSWDCSHYCTCDVPPPLVMTQNSCVQVHWASSRDSQGELCVHSRNWKARRWQLHPCSHPIPLFPGGRWFLHAGSRAGLNKSYKFQLNRFKGLGSSSPRWPKIAILHWLEVHIALTTCYTVMALLWFTTALFRFARWKLNQLISRLSILPEKNTRELRSTYTYR